ncbi:MAG: hypothetical protein JWO63_1612 [Frankiales bacterium]|nr:hypothetical protein [Frankiales bacterium]
MKLTLAGASGFLGQALAQSLTERGHHVETLVRRPARQASEIEWQPETGTLDPAALSGQDAVINLCGAGVGDKRWTPSYKKLLVDSRVQPTGAIATALASLDSHVRPAVFVSASAIGYFGDRAAEVLTESSSQGSGFLADLVAQWEAATSPAVDAGVRVATLRFGPVLAASGGILARLIPLFKLGLGGKLGSGDQFLSWITLADELAAVHHVLQSPSLSGPVNVVGPAPVTNAELSKALGQILHRPSIFPTPAFGLRLVLGEFADEGALASQRALPQALLDAGFAFEHSDIRSALHWARNH